MMRLTRRYRFCASHRLNSADLTEDQNRELYGKCNNPHGHGHDYALDITVAGTVDEETGLLLRLQDLDSLIGESILREFDHRNLNQDVAEFSGLVPTSENLARVIENRLKEKWPSHFSAGSPVLEKVSLHETKRNRFELRT
jgi:6-pyruvoyltetrahydropterin/6-carboxytetrahydropterin synthase